MSAEHGQAHPDLDVAQPGDLVIEAREILRRADLVAYADASGDANPIHQDEAFARAVGLPDVIAHGMLTMGLVASTIERAAGARAIASFAARFAAPVVVPAGDDEAPAVDIAVAVFARDDAAGTVTLEATVSVGGTKVLSRTRAVIQLD